MVKSLKGAKTVGDRTILVVDDEPGVRSSLKGVLEDEGFKVFTASSGEEALDQMPSIKRSDAIRDRWH